MDTKQNISNTKTGLTSNFAVYFLWSVSDLSQIISNTKIRLTTKYECMACEMCVIGRKS